VQPLWEHHQRELTLCLALLKVVSGCDDVIKEMKDELDDEVWSLSIVVGAVEDTVYNSARHCFVINKLLFRVRGG
jgi:hypothetical protein